jgi:hypothetical protein
MSVPSSGTILAVTSTLNDIAKEHQLYEKREQRSVIHERWVEEGGGLGYVEDSRTTCLHLPWQTPFLIDFSSLSPCFNRTGVC